MDHIGIDVHKRESQIYILADGCEVIEQRIRTEPERFAAVSSMPCLIRLAPQAPSSSSPCRPEPLQLPLARARVEATG